MIEVVYSTIRHYEKDKYVKPHSHNVWEFIQYLDVSGTTNIGEQNYNFEPGVISVVPPDVIHDEQNQGEGCIIAVGFKYDGAFPTHICTIPGDPFVLNLTQQIVHETEQKGFMYTMALEAALTQILLHLIRKHSIAENDFNPIDELIQFIDENYVDEIDLNDFAKSIGYTLDCVRVLFHKKTGLSPKQYILNKRLEYAVYLLQNTTLPLTEICFKCGFKYYSHFSAFFKKKFGKSPLACRNEQSQTKKE